MNEVLEEIGKIGIVPVIAMNHEKDAPLLGKALCDGGIPCAEVTFRTEAAAGAIKKMAEACPDMLIGAGTILTTRQVDEAMDAGAKFIVSPGLNPKVVEYCISKNIPVTPGCSTASDVEKAIELGLEVVKFFPAEASGGLEMIKALSAPYHKMKFMPTGGINENNLNSYLNFSKIIACGGSWMVKKELIESGDFEKITELSKEAVSKMLNYELRHVGINTESATEAEKTAEQFDALFGFHKKVGNSSIFAGKEIEVMKMNYLGEKGHIAICCNSVERAMYQMKRAGEEFTMDTAKYNDSGEITVIYLEKEIGGFAIHLVKR